MQGVQVRSLVGELRSHVPLGQEIETENRSNIVTNSIKTLKMIHIKKKNLKKKKKRKLRLPACDPLVLKIKVNYKSMTVEIVLYSLQ